MIKMILSKIPVNIITGLIALFCCLSTGSRGQSCPIAGGSAVCVGSTLALTDTCVGTWSSGAASVATISTSGVVTGVSAGTALISYLLPDGSFSTRSVTVNPLPNAGTITGTRFVCAGAYLSLSNATSGGTWSTSAVSIASVNVVGSVRGVSGGSAIISYSVTNSCGTAVDTQAVYVDTPLGTPTTGSYSTPSYCYPRVVSLAMYFSPSGGVFSAPFSLVGSITPSGIFTAGSATGSVTITYTLGNTCGSNTASWTIGVGHNAAAITGTASVCVGATTTLANASTGGTWSSSSPSTASVNAAGVVTGVATGTAVITYSLAPYAGCSASSSTRTVTVTTPAPITGSPDTICSGLTTTYHESVAGGTWSIFGTGGIATISPSGFITGISGFTIPYTVLAKYTCGASSVTKPVTVKPAPAAPTISGIPSPYICAGATATLTGSPSGGTWYTGLTTASAFASIDSVTGVLTGTATVASTGGPTSGALYSVRYKVTNSYGCSTTTTVTGNSSVPTVSAGTITGTTNLCPATTTSLSVTGDAMGVWSSSNTAVATVNASTGVAGYVGAGVAIITYTITGLCNADTATDTINTYPTPTAGTITTPAALCNGASLTLTTTGPTTFGTWTTSNPSVATVTASGALTGLATGRGTGTATIYYTVSNYCGTSYTSTLLSVIASPTISGTLQVCEGVTATSALSGSILGGTWSSSNPSIATIDAITGVVTGVAAGTATITYTVTATGCYGTANFTVNPSPTIGIGLNGNPPAPYPAVLCGNSINLTAYGAFTYTWNTSSYLYYAGTPTGYIPMTPATSVDVHTFSLPVMTYTITGTSTSGCEGTTTYSVVQPTCDASFCSPFSGTPIYSLSGNIGSAGTTTYMPSGNYNVADTTKFLGTVHFNGNVLAIAPNVPVFVDTSAELYIDSSHLYCCDKIQLWNGITLSAGATTSGKLTLNHHCLIEDAKTAIKIYNGIIPASGTGYTLLSVSTVYNCNRICIDVNQYPALGSPQPTPPYNYPFLVYDNVFTSRDLTQFVPASGYGWPMQYPATSGTSTALKAPYTPTALYASFMPHYNIINPNGAGATGVGYPYRALNDGTIANIGIRLVNVGSYATDTAPNRAATYNGITIGEDVLLGGNSGINLFDTLCEGIYALSSNLTSYNNTFMYMYRPTGLTTNPVGEGITAITGAIPLLAGVTTYPKYNLKIAGNSTPTNNQFFDCIKGASSQQYYNVDIENCYVISYPSATTVARGQNGFSILSRRFHDVTFKNNEITNVRSGLTLNTGIGGGFINQFSGNIDVSNNTINSNVGGAPPALGSGMEVLAGITLTNMYLAGTASGVYAIGNAFVDNNTMNYVYNGIDVNGYHFGQPVLTTNNNIRVNNRTGMSSAQYGISHRNCIGNTIISNTVNGPGSATPIATFGTSAVGKITGIYATAVNVADITCNYTGDLNVGFQFFSANTMNWHNNEMNRSRVGMVLNGTFGDQGNYSMPSNNIWKNTLSWWASGSGNYNIYTYNPSTFSTSPWADSIYVEPNASGGTSAIIYDPLNNSNFFPGFTRCYGAATAGTGNGLILLTGTATIPSCLLVYSTYSKMAKTVTAGVGDNPAQNWIAQNGVWQAIQRDASLTDSSIALQQFATMANTSRYKWISDIEAAIMNGDKSTASSLLAMDIHAYIDTATDSATGVSMKDGIGADEIVSTYVTLYNQYVKYMDSTMSGDDSIAVKTIANLCPLTYGNAVYQAQALYRILYEDDTMQFDGNCETDTSARHSQPYAEFIGSQVYKLFPNPNSGGMTIKQNIVENGNVQLSVRDVLGRTVYSGATEFKEGNAQVDLSRLDNGVYILQLTDVKQKTSNFTFVIQK